MQASEKYKNETTAKYYDLVGKYYAESEGPYLLGDKVTYADFAVYQSMDNDRRTGTIVVCFVSYFLSSFRKNVVPRGICVYANSYCPWGRRIFLSRWSGLGMLLRRGRILQRILRRRSRDGIFHKINMIVKCSVARRAAGCNLRLWDYLSRLMRRD